jgi:hypothetical protein
MSIPSHRRGLIRLFLASLAIRLGALIASGAWNAGLETAHHEHACIARSLAEGNGFRFNFYGDIRAPSLTSHQAPLVPGLLAASYRLLGIETSAAFAAMLTLECVVSALTVVLIAWTAGGTMDSADDVARIRTFAGLIAMLYPPLIVAALHVQALAFNLFWLSLLIAGAQAIRRSLATRGVWWMMIGGVGGILTDPILAAPLVALLAFLCLERRGRDPRSYDLRSLTNRRRRIAVIAIGVAVGIAPWLYRNILVHGRFIFIKDSFWYVFWQGNNNRSQGTDKLLVADDDAVEIRTTWSPTRASEQVAAARRRAISIDSTLSPSFIAELQQLPTEIERMDRFRALAMQEILSRPGLYLRQCLRRARLWIGFDATNPRSFSIHYWLSYLALVVAVAPGIWLGRRRWFSGAPIVVAALALSAVHVFVITSARFRIPLEMLMAFPAAVALDHAMRCVGRLAQSQLGRPKQSNRAASNAV